MTDGPVLVIGGTRGTGLLIARLLQRQGYAVRILARDPNRTASFLSPQVGVVPGDITRAKTLPSAMEGIAHIVFTAGCASGRPASEHRVRATEYDGVRNTLAAAQQAGFAGRFLYMTSSAVGACSVWAVALNLYKGNTLAWRRRAEDEIRASGIAYTIIRAGMLVNRPAGTRAIVLPQRLLPMSLRHRIARADVAETFVAALRHRRTVRTTFAIIWGGTRRESLTSLMDRLHPDSKTDSDPDYAG
jgi:uncharacterized protein YbjT (DUF2867 family)